MKRLLLLASVLFGLGLLWHDLQTWWSRPGPASETTAFTVGAGASLTSVSLQLSESGVLERPRLWRWLIRVQGRDGDIKRGEYQLEAGLSPAALLEVLVGGRVRHYSVTLPEGITLNEAIGILQQDAVLEHTLNGPDDERILALAQPFSAGEGLFFPDTYRFVRGDSDYQILAAARLRLQEQLDAAWLTRDVGTPYQTSYEALIMASVVEKETGTPQERNRIAGVFVRRLEKNMRLQTDPSVIYGLGPEFDGNLRRKHLQDASNPYNSYRHSGLPPTPIALPGRAALDAAMHPAPGSELYFVARGDGSHEFSDTLEQHQKAVRAWQHRRVQNYRSSPAPDKVEP